MDKMPRPWAAPLTLSLVVAMVAMVHADNSDPDWVFEYGFVGTFEARYLQYAPTRYCGDDLVAARQEACQIAKYHSKWELNSTEVLRWRPLPDCCDEECVPADFYTDGCGYSEVFTGVKLRQAIERLVGPNKELNKILKKVKGTEKTEKVDDLIETLKWIRKKLKRLFGKLKKKPTYQLKKKGYEKLTKKLNLLKQQAISQRKQRYMNTRRYHVYRHRSKVLDVLKKLGDHGNNTKKSNSEEDAGWVKLQLPERVAKCGRNLVAAPVKGRRTGCEGTAFEPCRVNPCGPNQYCTTKPLWNYKCHCDPTFAPDRRNGGCQKPNPCLDGTTVDCGPGRFCFAKSEEEHECRCKDTFVGTQCLKYDPCKANPCPWGKVCTPNTPFDWGHKCSCAAYYVSDGDGGCKRRE